MCREKGDISMIDSHKYHCSTKYRIKLKGRLDPKWSDWFEQMKISTEGGETILTGPVAVQAALHGLLRKVRDLGMPLLSVNRVNPGRADAPDVAPRIPWEQ
jgi:hypothetical protein